MREIIILTNHLKYGGAERQSVYLANRLSKHFKVKYVVWDKGLYDESFIHFTRKYVENIIILNHKGYLGRFHEIYKIIKNSDDAVIISYLATTNVLNGLIKILNPSVISIGGIRSQVIKSQIKLIIQRFIHNKLLDWTVANNYTVIPYLKENKFDITKISVVRNCVLKPEYVATNSKKNSVKTIITISRIVNRKDLPTAIHAVKNLRDRLPSQKFLYKIIGDGDQYQSLIKLVDQLELSDICILIRNTDVQEAYKEADIYLSTSIIEGTSNSILEAMSHGLPIVATDAGDNKIIVKHGENGFIAQIGNSHELSDYLAELLIDENLFKNFSEKSKEIVNEGFSLERFEKNNVEIINYLLHKNET